VIVAVEERDADAVEFEVAELTVTGFAGGGDGAGELGLVVVAVAENEVGRPGREQGDDFGRADVATVEDGVDVEAFEQAQGRARELDVAVGVADDAESHGAEFKRRAFARCRQRGGGVGVQLRRGSGRRRRG